MTKNYNIQKRRNEKLSKLRYDSPRSFKKNFLRNAVMRTLIAIILFVVIYFSFTTDTPITTQIRSFIEENLVKEINFSQLYDTYIGNFAGNPALIPSFIKDSSNDNLSEYAFTSPISDIPTSIKETEQGLFLDTAINEQVLAIGKGLVVNVGEHYDYGKTIVVRYENNIECVYAMLDEILVKKNDWIDPGQNLGSVKNRLFFTLYDKKKYISPLDVIKFD